MAQGPQLSGCFNILQPPAYCEYAGGPCDQTFDGVRRSHAVFLYPSDPGFIASTIESTVGQLRSIRGDRAWLTWRDLGVTGQIIFCQICKAVRFSSLVVADVTTLNFNLLFEIGFALGLGVPVLPIRDSNVIQDQQSFDELGLLDTLGYLDFQSSQELISGVAQHTLAPFTSQTPPINAEQPLFLVKSHVQNEGMIRLMSALKKSGLRFRSFDPRETPRLSLHEAYKQVHSSLGLILHLVAPTRSGATVHNARCAFVAGMGMAAGKRVLMLQESVVQHPIDYRDVVQPYTDAIKIPDLLIPFIRQIVEKLQDSRFIARLRFH